MNTLACLRPEHDIRDHGSQVYWRWTGGLNPSALFWLCAAGAGAAEQAEGVYEGGRRGGEGQDGALDFVHGYIMHIKIQLR